MSTGIPPSPSPTSGLPSASLGLGCVTFGREIDRDASFRLMDHALAHGVTTFDTAAAYAAGASERTVGDWLSARAPGVRAAIHLGTKILPPYSAATLASSVQQSLDRLHIDALDTLYLHRWDDTVLAPDFLPALASLVSSGRVRQLGASNFTVAQLQRAVSAQTTARLIPFRTLQNVHNLALRSIDSATATFCADRAISLVTYSPLGAGFLTGKYDQGIPAGTRFDVIPGHQPLYFTPESRARLSKLQFISARENIPVVDLALAWALHQPFPSTVLIGGRTPSHLDQALRAAALDRPDLFKELSAA